MTRKLRQPKFSSSKKGPDFEKHANKLGLARMLARKELPYMYKGLNSLTMIVTDKAAPYGTPTFMVDPYFRMYAHPEAIDRFIEEAKSVSVTNPCETCGADSHIDLAYVAGVITHEMWHPLRKHSDRAKKIDNLYPMIWNAAADLELNDDLVESFGLNKIVCLPPQGLLPKHYGFKDGRLAEEYYYLLIEEAEKAASQAGGEGDTLEDKLKDLIDKMEQQPCGSGATGQAEPWEEGEPNEASGNAPGLTKAEGTLLEKEMAQEIKDHAGKHPGKVPSDYVRWANELLKGPKYDWRRELQKMVRYSANMARGDTFKTYRRLSRLTAAIEEAAILPSNWKPLPVISIVEDTSGSMTNSLLKTAMQETQGICRTAGTEVNIIECDAAAGNVQKARGHVKNIVLHGGGGTDMGIGIAVAEAQHPKPNIIIIMTDGETPWPAAPQRGIRYIACLIGNKISDYIINGVPTWMQKIIVEPDDDI